ncbi:MAG: NAD(P)-dependent oxidoreductase [Bryobacterales bacterium]|nr:NAD(P)-dependent oxidoreductase [Bryobacterales bacterium]
MKIAVTGAASFIGAALHRYCQEQGIGWTGLDFAPPGEHHAVRCDISEPGWERYVDEDTTALVHLAAISRTPDCRRDPARAIAVNITGTWRAIEAARLRGVRQLVFASSEWVYGEASTTRAEDSPIDAGALTGEYALTKLAGERLLAMAAAARPELAATVLRFGIVYGPREAANWSALESVLAATLERDRVEVGSLATARRFIHVDDIARGIVASIGRPAGFDVFNLTGDRLVTLGDVIEEGARLRGGRRPEVVETAAARPSIRDVDNAKARAQLGWAPRVGLGEGLAALAAALHPAGEEVRA